MDGEKVAQSGPAAASKAVAEPAAGRENKVAVAVRCRSLNPSELDVGCQPTVLTCDETKEVVAGGRNFRFDQVYGPGATQRSIFQDSVRPLVEAVGSGINGTIIAYGQTGAGKTYTMGSSFRPEEDAEARGIIPRAMGALLAAVHAKKDEWETQVTATFVEIYNEELRDLLAADEEAKPKGRRGLQLRKDKWGNYGAKGLAERTISSLADLSEALAYGAERRTTAATNMNATSSRSHAIVTIRLDQTPLATPAAPLPADDPAVAADCDGDKEKAPEEAGPDTAPASGGEGAAGSGGATLASRRVSLFRFVDLAGSERCNQTGATGKRLVEANNINLSLSTLGRCINALASKAPHVPFRNSKLTQLLTNSLGGNSKTLMIACVSPADVNLEQTVQTLRYAKTAANITNKATVNTDMEDASPDQLRRQVSSLQAELRRLHAGGAAVAPAVRTALGLEATPAAMAFGAAGGRRQWGEERLATASGSYDVQSAVLSAENAELKAQVAAAEAEAAHQASLCEAARDDMRQMGERGAWAAQQAAALLDESMRQRQALDMWEWRARTLARACGMLALADHASEEAKQGDDEDDEDVVVLSPPAKPDPWATLPDHATVTASQVRLAGEVEALAMLQEARAPPTLVNPAGVHGATRHGAPELPSAAGQEAHGPGSKAAAAEEEAGAGPGAADDDHAAVAAASELDIAHLRSQVALRGQLEAISSMIEQKEAEYAREAEEHVGAAGDFDAARRAFEAEMERSQQERAALAERVDRLQAELAEAKGKQAEAGGGAGKKTRRAKARAHAAAQRKDKELTELRGKLRAMEEGMQSARAEHRRHEQRAANLTRLRSEIDDSKREKVELEKEIRSAAKKYAAERKQLIKERSQANRRERQAALALQRAQRELEVKAKQLEASRQRERARKAKEAVLRRNRASARTTRRAEAAAAAAAAGGLDASRRQRTHSANSVEGRVGEADPRRPGRRAGPAAAASGAGRAPPRRSARRKSLSHQENDVAGSRRSARERTREPGTPSRRRRSADAATPGKGRAVRPPTHRAAAGHLHHAGGIRGGAVEPAAVAAGLREQLKAAEFVMNEYRKDLERSTSQAEQYRRERQQLNGRVKALEAQLVAAASAATRAAPPASGLRSLHASPAGTTTPVAGSPRKAGSSTPVALPRALQLSTPDNGSPGLQRFLSPATPAEHRKSIQDMLPSVEEVGFSLGEHPSEAASSSAAAPPPTPAAPPARPSVADALDSPGLSPTTLQHLIRTTRGRASLGSQPLGNADGHSNAARRRASVGSKPPAAGGASGALHRSRRTRTRRARVVLQQ